MAENPTQLGRYQIEEHLGAGAHADVYRASDPLLKRMVALKVLKPALIADEDVFARFTREAQVLASLVHPHIAWVWDMGEADGSYYIAMRYVEGRSLARLIAEHGALSWEEALLAVCQAAEGLQFAHQKGLVHRDVKPQNIIISETDGAVLTDFGLVRAIASSSMTSTGAMLGTPQYMAPEVWEIEEPDPGADQYALACVLVEMLTGKILFDGKTPPIVMARHFKPLELPASLNEIVPEGIEAVLRKALAQNPAERYASVKEFTAALEEPQSIKPKISPRKIPKRNINGAHATGRPAVLKPKADSLQAIPAAGVESTPASPGQQRAGFQTGVWLPVLLAVLLAAMFGLAYYLNSAKEKTYTVEATPTLGTAFIFSNADGVVSSIEVKPDAGEAVKIARNAENSWEVILPTRAEADQGLAESAAAQITALPVSSQIEDGKDPGIFGLNYPAYTITIEFKGGNKRTLEVGYATPTNSGYYVRVDNYKMMISSLSGIDALLQLGFLPPYLNTPTPIIPTESPVFGLGSRMTGEDGMTLLYVPEGEFSMGSDTGEEDEKPAHPVYLDAFWIDETEVTNKQYAGCVSSGACTPPSSNSSNTQTGYYGNAEFDNYPVIYVNWDQAQAYCAWAGRRLPTEAEWEKAARGPDGNTYPWGETAPSKNLLNFNGNVGDTTAVGKYPDRASPYGALDMAGNVWEWVNDPYDATYYQSSPSSNPLGPVSGDGRVLRGGSWLDYVSGVRSAIRFRLDPAYTSYYGGFRCARGTSP